MKESGLRIRVEDQLRNDFLQICKKNDLTAAQVIRAFMRTYVEKRSQGQQFDLFNEATASLRSDAANGEKI